MIIVRAPVRMSFGGGGTDLEAYYAPFGGFVVSATIARYCSVLARESPDGHFRITSLDYQIAEAFEPGSMPAPAGPLALAKAALARFAERDLCANGVELVLSADVPPGSGLGSSSAMAVALVQALAAYAGVSMDTAELAELACELEIKRLGMPIGKQDQFASAFGGLNTIAFTAEGVRVQPLDLPTDVAAALNARLLLFSTGQSRAAASILRQQQADTASNSAVIETLHTIKALAFEIRDALLSENLNQFGQLLDQSWHAKRQLSEKVSSLAIDNWYAAAREAGALGGKIAGAGGGGFLLLYCPPSRQGRVRRVMSQLGLRELPFTFDQCGARVLTPDTAPRSTRKQFSFPRAPIYDTETRSPIRESLEHYWHSLAELLGTMSFGPLMRAAEALLDCHQRGNTIFILGNGGSAATASHLACDLAKGTRVDGLPRFRVVPLTDNVPLLTAWGNDTSYDRVFAEQLAALARPGDMVVAISVSGNSPNVLRAVETARQLGATTLALTGGRGGELGRLADLAILVPDGSVEQVEDAHLVIAHSLCVALRQQCHILAAAQLNQPALLEEPLQQPIEIELGR
jgi:D-glycero-alpha-D-manno-heptose-7-phosphate kinase